MGGNVKMKKILIDSTGVARSSLAQQDVGTITGPSTCVGWRMVGSISFILYECWMVIPSSSCRGRRGGGTAVAKGVPY